MPQVLVFDTFKKVHEQFVKDNNRFPTAVEMSNLAQCAVSTAHKYSKASGLQLHNGRRCHNHDKFIEIYKERTRGFTFPDAILMNQLTGLNLTECVNKIRLHQSACEEYEEMVFEAMTHCMEVLQIKHFPTKREFKSCDMESLYNQFTKVKGPSEWAKKFNLMMKKDYEKHIINAEIKRAKYIPRTPGQKFMMMIERECGGRI